MWYLYLIVIALAAGCCVLFMGLVRVVPDAIKSGEKLSKKTYAKVLGLVVLVVLIAAIMGRYRCDDCGILGATNAFEGGTYCDECYEDRTS